MTGQPLAGQAQVHLAAGDAAVKPTKLDNCVESSRGSPAMREPKQKKFDLQNCCRETRKSPTKPKLQKQFGVKLVKPNVFPLFFASVWNFPGGVGTGEHV